MLIKNHFPSVKFQTDCETLVAAAWGRVEEMCPKGQETTVSFPSPEEIEKLVCKVASSELIEIEATDQVCTLIKGHFPSVKFQPDCETAVAALWDEVKAMCPNGKETISFPSPEDIEKLVCKVASSELIEKEATEEVCTLIKEHFPSVKLQPDCETVVAALWDEVKAMCPKGKETISFPSPEDIEKLVCKVASSEL